MAHVDKKQVALYLTGEESDKITYYADKIGISRQKLMSNIIKGGIDDLAKMEKLGVIAIGVGVRDLFRKFKSGEVDSIDQNSEQS